MKINLLSPKNVIIIAMFIFTSCISKKTKTEDLVIKFEKDIYDFGEIKIGNPVEVYYKFSNEGKENLKLEYVTSTCGCTVSKWSKKTIKYQGQDSIKVIYNAKYLGDFNERITVFYNGENTPKHLTITGKVVNH